MPGMMSSTPEPMRMSDCNMAKPRTTEKNPKPTLYCDQYFIVDAPPLSIFGSAVISAGAIAIAKTKPAMETRIPMTMNAPPSIANNCPTMIARLGVIAIGTNIFQLGLKSDHADFSNVIGPANVVEDGSMRVKLIIIMGL